MKETDLFAAAIGLVKPWFITSVDLKMNDAAIPSMELHIKIVAEPGSKFVVDGELCPVYDHQERTWRHLNFFQHVCYLHASVPRVKSSTGRVSLVEVPWSEPGSSFTLLFEMYSMLLVKSGMSLAAAGVYLNIDPRAINRIIKRRVSNQLAQEDLEQVKILGIDETSTARGHKYVTVLTDSERKKVVGLGIGKGVEAVDSAVLEMEVRNSDSKEVDVISMDLSPAYISAAQEVFPQADIVFDRFHLTALLNKAIDEIRRSDQKDNSILRKSRYLWLRNHADLSEEKKAKVEYLAATCPRIGKAYRLKEQFREVFVPTNQRNPIDVLIEWTNLAWESGLEELQKFVETLDRHWAGIETYFKWKVSNGFAERVNLKIQEIKRLARGYSNLNNFMTMIYFHLGGLNLGLPTKNG